MVYGKVSFCHSRICPGDTLQLTLINLHEELLYDGLKDVTSVTKLQINKSLPFKHNDKEPSPWEFHIMLLNLVLFSAVEYIPSNLFNITKLRLIL